MVAQSLSEQNNEESGRSRQKRKYFGTKKKLKKKNQVMLCRVSWSVLSKGPNSFWCRPTKYNIYTKRKAFMSNKIVLPNEKKEVLMIGILCK